MDDEQHKRLRAEVASRRTFAIISHPDAGKTTLTEKLLLYGGAVHLAGSVRAKARRPPHHQRLDGDREAARHLRLDAACCSSTTAAGSINLLDTPGHNDFCEDTYRTLAAADCAIMLIDSVKGVEPQTIKLFQVCRMRGIPIVTFVNKMDRDGKDPLELLDEIERVLGIPCSPANWPIGAGRDVRGRLRPLRRKRRCCFERGRARPHAADMQVSGLDDPALRRRSAARAASAKAARGARAADTAPATPSTRERFLRRRADAGVLRQRHDQLRRSSPSSTTSSSWRRRRARAPPRPAPLDARRAALLRLRLQDPGEHGSAAPRPHRLRAHLLGPLRARHGGHARAHRQDADAVSARCSSWPRSAP